jgi:hypothetical protein
MCGVGAQEGQGERPALSRKEREEIEKQAAQARYWKLHEQVRPNETKGACVPWHRSAGKRNPKP